MAYEVGGLGLSHIYLHWGYQEMAVRMDYHNMDQEKGLPGNNSL